MIIAPDPYSLPPRLDRVDVTHWRGHRLPLRISFNGDRIVDGSRESVVIWFEIFDADHRVVEPHIKDFDQALGLVEHANGSMIRHTRAGPVGQRYTGSLLARVSDLHPCERYHVRTALAFECMILERWGAPTHWISDDLRGDVQMVGVFKGTDRIQPQYVERWWRWRAAEDAALKRRGMQ